MEAPAQVGVASQAGRYELELVLPSTELIKEFNSLPVLTAKQLDSEDN